MTARKHNKTRQDIIEDYLRFLVRKTNETMASKFGLTYEVLAKSDLILYISQPGKVIIMQIFA